MPLQSRFLPQVLQDLIYVLGGAWRGKLGRWEWSCLNKDMGMGDPVFGFLNPGVGSPDTGLGLGHTTNLGQNLQQANQWKPFIANKTIFFYMLECSNA